MATQIEQYKGSSLMEAPAGKAILGYFTGGLSGVAAGALGGSGSAMKRRAGKEDEPVPAPQAEEDSAMRRRFMSGGASGNSANRMGF